MALVNCPECNSSVSDQAAACPQCGHPIRPQQINPSPPQTNSTPQVVKSAKSRGVYIILGLFFGCLGIHNFYAGYNSRGVTQLLLVLILGWFVIGLLIVVPWVIIELITVTHDAAGDKMV